MACVKNAAGEFTCETSSEACKESTYIECPIVKNCTELPTKKACNTECLNEIKKVKGIELGCEWKDEWAKCESVEMPTREKAMEVTGIKNENYMEILIGGYQADKGTASILKNHLAGIYLGTVTVKITKEGTVTRYDSLGSYAPDLTNQKDIDALKKVLLDADTNKDKIITRQEMIKLQEKIYAEQD
jgi:hypothetical protein